ncbi:hypothetical protein NITHO_5230003 [Nitrolancea hollandica Lb]|uniref:Uncharacterized protein n=1 Tax=Nitrolancea hollandica Lb TaxID=1129897 RepID=I4ELQ1_9BACT|nr:hypothetical protein NITHO_5230003 [Nitrolancea hollandica Lb]
MLSTSVHRRLPSGSGNSVVPCPGLFLLWQNLPSDDEGGSGCRLAGRGRDLGWLMY